MANGEKSFSIYIATDGHVALFYIFWMWEGNYACCMLALSCVWISMLLMCWQSLLPPDRNLCALGPIQSPGIPKHPQVGKPSQTDCMIHAVCLAGAFLRWANSSPIDCVSRSTFFAFVCIGHFCRFFAFFCHFWLDYEHFGFFCFISLSKPLKNASFRGFKCLTGNWEGNNCWLFFVP